MTFDVISLASILITSHVIIVIALALIWITIKARCNMGKLLYYDGATAVCDFEENEIGTREKAVKLLLEVDADNPNTEKHVKPLLECWGIGNYSGAGLTVGLTKEQKADIEKLADKKALAKLGYVVKGCAITPADFKTFPPLRIQSNVSETVKRIRNFADYLQYLAKLYLLANGDERMAPMIPDMTRTQHSMQLVITLPWAFRYSFETQRLKTKARFDAKHMQTVEDSRLFSVPVEIFDIDVFRSPYHSKGSVWKMPEDDFGVKKVIASALLSSLINYQASMPYTNDPETLALERSSGDTLANTLAENMLAGKIRACPHCGRPMLVKREKGMQYCSASCRTLYNRKAKEMCSNGASVDEVHTSFPAIPKETIRGWLPMEGR